MKATTASLMIVMWPYGPGRGDADMGWLDNFIAWLSPEWGARREAWRQGLEEMKSYDAGSDHRLNAGWRTWNQSAESTDVYSRDMVRARARDLERNSDVMNSIIGAVKRNVVGSGYRLQAMTSNEKLNEEIEKLWKKWCKTGNCEVTGAQSFTQLLRMLVVRKKVDGGVLIVKRYVDNAEIPLQLQIFEVDELDGGVSTPRNLGCRVVGGIEYNSYNRAVGYWINQYQIDGFSLTEPIYIPAEDVIFYFTKKRPSQVREMSDMAPTLTRIRDLNEFITAVSVKQRIMACLSVFIKKTIPPVGLGRQNRPDDRKSYDGKTLTPGMMKELNAGDDIEVVNPTGQSADATSFTKLQQRMIGAGQGLSYESTSRDMSETSYSSARQGIIEDDLTFAEEVEQLMAVMDKIYEAFIDCCFLTGLLKRAGYWSDKDAYCNHAWIKQPKAWIDPLKEASATKTALNYGIKTFKQVAAENGRDWKAQIDDMVEVNEYAKSKGLDLGGVLLNVPKENPQGNDNGGAGNAPEGEVTEPRPDKTEQAE